MATTVKLATGVTERIRFIEPGTTVNHPKYGVVTVDRNVDRGDLTTVGGFPPATFIIHPERGRMATYANEFVTVIP